MEKRENLPATPTTTNTHAHMAANIVAESGIITAAFILSTLWKKINKQKNIKNGERETENERKKNAAQENWTSVAFAQNELDMKNLNEWIGSPHSSGYQMFRAETKNNPLEKNCHIEIKVNTRRINISIWNVYENPLVHFELNACGPNTEILSSVKQFEKGKKQFNEGRNY